MIRIAFTAAAYKAIRESLPAKSRRYAPQKAVGGGGFLISVQRRTLNKLEALRERLWA
jgi:hypothetical protein